MITFYLGLLFLMIFAIGFYKFYSKHRKYSWWDTVLNDQDILLMIILTIIISLIILTIALTGVGATESNIYYYHI